MSAGGVKYFRVLQKRNTKVHLASPTNFEFTACPTIVL